MVGMAKLELWQYGAIKFVQEDRWLSVYCTDCDQILVKVADREHYVCSRKGCRLVYLPDETDGLWRTSHLDLGMWFVDDRRLSEWFKAWTGEPAEVKIKW